MAGFPTQKEGHRKRSNQSAADSHPVKKKRVAPTNISSVVLESSAENSLNSESAASPGSDEPIFQHLRTLKVAESKRRRRPLSSYMEKVQEEINPVMRTILVDWLVAVAREFGLASDTLFLTVNYLDRYLSTRKVFREKLQLLGVSCMLVASKYEETWPPPRIGDFCCITDYTYTKAEVVDMEIDVLEALEYEMGGPTTKTFLRIFTSCSSAAQENSDTPFKCLCGFIAELSLTDYYSCVGYIPSVVAASVIFLARLIMQPRSHPWTPALQKHTGYEAFELKGCVLRLHNLLLHTSETSARTVRRKYECVEFMRPPFQISASFFKSHEFSCSHNM